MPERGKGEEISTKPPSEIKAKTYIRVRIEMKNPYFFKTVFHTLFGGKCAFKVELRNTAFKNHSSATIPADTYIAHPIPSFGYSSKTNLDEE